MSAALAKLAAFQQLLASREFYGDVHIKFDAGEPVHVKVDQSYRIDTLPQPQRKAQSGAQADAEPR